LPNPVHNEIHLPVENPKVFKLCDIQGKQFFRILDSYSESIDNSDLLQGIYFGRIEKAGVFYKFKFIKA